MGASWSIPYGASNPTPFWGAQTSAVNFCEEDYIITHYVGEFFNTLTSLCYIGYGYYGIQRYRRQNIHPFSAVNFPYWGLIGVGIFSGLYHSTLKYHTQMSDELSMHVAIGTVLQQVFTFQEPPAIARRNTAIILGILVPFVIYHCVADEFVLHVILFFGMVLLVAYRTRHIIKFRIHDREHRRQLSSLSTFGLSLAGIAWLLWNIDVHLCAYVTKAKHALGMPWGIVLELHGWWHILTAIASYTFMAVIEFLTNPDFDESHGIGFAWPAKRVLEDLVPKQLIPGHAAVNGNGKANGATHKRK